MIRSTKHRSISEMEGGRVTEIVESLLLYPAYLNTASRERRDPDLPGRGNFPERGLVCWPVVLEVEPRTFLPYQESAKPNFYYETGVY